MTFESTGEGGFSDETQDIGTWMQVDAVESAFQLSEKKCVSYRAGKLVGEVSVWGVSTGYG